MNSKITALFCTLLTAAALFASSCSNTMERDIEEIKARISNMEQAVNDINGEISKLSALVKALQSNDYISRVQTTSDGCVVVFQSGAVMSLRNAVDGKVPILGIQYDSLAGRYCWTISYGNSRPTWLLDDYGLRISAEIIVPKLRITDGYWQVTYDDGDHWTNLFESIGEAGSSIFRSVDWSDPYYVRFTLLNGTVFTIPTTKASDDIYLGCQQVNRGITACRTLLDGVSGVYFVSSVTEIIENGATSGYVIMMEDGTEFTVRSGKDETEGIYFGIAVAEDGLRYWRVRFGNDATGDWLYVNGERVPADPTDNQPRIGVQLEEGVFYFTVGYDNGPTSWLLNGAGERVKAQAGISFNFFKEATVDAGHVYLKSESGETITLPRVARRVLSLEIPSPEEVYCDSTFTYELKVSESAVYAKIPFNDVAAYKADSGMDVRVIAVDGGYASIDWNGATFTATPVNLEANTISGTYDYLVKIPVTLKTAAEIKVPGTTRVAVFLSWGTNTTMKIIEVENKLRNPQPISGEDPEPVYDVR